MERRIALIWTILLILSCTAPAGAQDRPRVQLQQSATGGVVSGGAFSLFSSVGAAAPSGRTTGGDFAVASGGRSIVQAPPPVLRFEHAPVDLADEGTPLRVSGAVSKGTVLESATLFYRRGGDPTYKSVPMTEPEAGAWEAAIPPDEVTSEGVAYYLEVTDRSGRIQRSPPTGEFGVPVRVGAPGLASTVPSPGGSEQSAYRLVSVPIELDAPDAESVFADDLGSYDPDRWRFFELLFNQDVREFPSTQPVRPGRSFWLITRDAQPPFDTGSGISADPAKAYRMPVHPRWNLIANPFHFTLPASNVSLRSGEAPALRTFEGAWNDPINDQVTELQPFAGYALFNPSQTVDTLYFEPLRTQSGAASDVKVAASTDSEAASAAPGHTERVAPGQAASVAAGLDWSVRIRARSDGAEDADNVAGVSRHAAAGIDAMDHPEPPVIGTFVSAYFVRPDWPGLTAAFSTDVRSPDLIDGSWDLRVRSSTGKPVHLAFEGVESVPEAYEVVLVDEIAGIKSDLRERGTYVLADPGSTEPRPLRLLVASDGRISQMTAHLQLVPDAVELAPVFPNPVRGSVTIRYGLPEAGSVVLRLYDGLGRLVRDIANRSDAEGYHVLVWEPSGSGQHLANGVYHLVLQAGGVRRVRTLTIVQ